jgi:hypothetical protein
MGQAQCALLLIRRSWHEERRPAVIRVIADARIEVEHHIVPPLDLPLSRPPGWVDGVPPRQDQCGRAYIGIQVAGYCFGYAANLDFRHAGADSLDNPFQDGVVDLRRPLQEGDLGLRLDLPKVDEKLGH